VKIFFAHRRLPMSKKVYILCVLRVSVVKNIPLIRNCNYEKEHLGSQNYFRHLNNAYLKFPIHKEYLE